MTRALVLGSGGLAGIAWEWGMLAGLAAAGIDLSDADVVIGTSAGSVVGVQLTAGTSAEEGYLAQFQPPDGELGGVLGTGVLLRYLLAAAGPGAPRTRRARIGRFAVRANTGSAADRVGVITSRLLVDEWPDRPLRITAVDVDSGEFVVFDRESDAPVGVAVAASCAVPGVWPPVPIDGHSYMDGGMRSPANTDVAAGHDRVVVLAPLARGVGGGVDTEVRRLTSARPATRVAAVTPDVAALRSFGRNVLDATKGAPAARSGRVQAEDVAERVRAVWH